MQADRRSANILYALIALFTLVLTGVALVVIVSFVQNRTQEQENVKATVAVAQNTGTQMAVVLNVTAVPTATPTDIPPTTTPVPLSSISTDTPTDLPTDVPTDTPQVSSTPAPTIMLSDTPTSIPIKVQPESSTVTFVPTPTHTPTLTPTDTPSITPSYTATDTFTPSSTPSGLPTATSTFTPTHTPTSTDTPSITPTPTSTLTPTIPPTDTITPIPSATETPNVTPTRTPTPLPGASGPMPLVPTGDYDMLNILLLGSDQRPGDRAYRTDTIIVVSVNRTTNSVNLLSIPRDLYIYIPGYGFDRINTASERGDFNKWPGRGAGLVAYAITYNLGIRIDRFAKINFSGFKQIVDSVDGIDIAVDCPLSDYKLASPTLDPNVESNYKWYTLPVGYHHMDGATALWYARSRYTTSDFDRSRRQQMVLRAIWRKLLARDLVSQLPTLWPEINKIVDTNLTLPDIAGLLPIATALDSARLHSYFLGPGQVKSWTTSEGAQVLLPQTKPIRDLVTLFYTPPIDNRLYTEQPSLQIYNGTAKKAWDKVAASRLSWEGFDAWDEGVADSTDYPRTVIYDYTGNAKPSSLKTLQRILNVKKDDIISLPDPERKADFRVILGTSYNACTYSPYQSAN
ncbi:MAG: LCP family protein [Anaerolineae bacterium]|nr:LCP family protein [Anaerolineae bacterium]